MNLGALTKTFARCQLSGGAAYQRMSSSTGDPSNRVIAVPF
jgi:hypothetical protein